MPKRILLVVLRNIFYVLLIASRMKYLLLESDFYGQLIPTSASPSCVYTTIALPYFSSRQGYTATVVGR